MLKISKRLQEVGKIKIGRKSAAKTSTNAGKTFRLPQKLDHFIVVKNVKNDDDFVIDDSVMSKVGNSPRSLEVILLSDKIEDSWQSERAYYTGSGALFCRSDDGETASRAKTEKRKIDGKDVTVVTEERFSMPCAGNNCPHAIPDKDGIIRCKPHGRLFVALPQSNQLGGVYVFRTTSWNTIVNIQSQLEFIHSMTHGVLAGLKLSLKISPKSVKYKGKGGIAQSTTIFEVGLFFEGNMEDLYKIASSKAGAFLEGRKRLAEIQIANKEIGDMRLPPSEAVKMVQEFNPEVAKEDDDMLSESTTTSDYELIDETEDEEDMASEIISSETAEEFTGEMFGGKEK